MFNFLSFTIVSKLRVEGYKELIKIQQEKIKDRYLNEVLLMTTIKELKAEIEVLKLNCNSYQGMNCDIDQGMNCDLYQKRNKEMEPR